jgi:hypothetical protein
MKKKIEVSNVKPVTLLIHALHHHIKSDKIFQTPPWKVVFGGWKDPHVPLE